MIVVKSLLVDHKRMRGPFLNQLMPYLDVLIITLGPTREAAFVTEHHPKAGQVRSWYENCDQAGTVNRVHPKMIDGQIVKAPTLSTNTKRTGTMGAIIMYTRVDFGHELKKLVTERYDVEYIGWWSHDTYTNPRLEIDLKDREFYRICITLGTMELGPDFARSYERLNEIADDLIAGKSNINLDY